MEMNQIKNQFIIRIDLFTSFWLIIIELEMGQQPSTLNCKINENN
jgi:hypothetical protein